MKLEPPADAPARLAAFAARNSAASLTELGREFLEQTYLGKWDRREFNRPGRWDQLKLVRARMDAGDYAGALDLFKTYSLQKLRTIDDYGLPRARFDPFSSGVVGAQWIRPLIQPDQRQDILKQAEELMSGSLKAGGHAIDIGEPGAINWKAASEAAQPGGYGWPWGLDAFSPLLAAYVLTGQQPYLDRWAAYADDWAMNQIYGVSATGIADIPDSWSGGAGTTVDLLRYFGGVAGLPNGAESFPGPTYARVMMRLLDDHIPDTIVYLRSNPQNWTDTALTTVPDLGYFLDEYPLGQKLLRESRRWLELLPSTHHLPDGPDLDSTVGYGGMYLLGAGTFLNRLVTRQQRIPDWMLTGWEKSEWRDNFDLEFWMRDVRQEMMKRARFLVDHTMANGEWPIGGARSDRRQRGAETYAGMLYFVPEILQDPDAARILSIGNGRPDYGAPSFTSERFPYSGLTYIRAGWQHDDPYLFLFCAPAPQGGCLSWRNNNAIGLSAFNHDLLETGENGTYDQPHSPVRVDGEEQFFHLGIPTWGHRGAALTASGYDRPAPWRWHDSLNFTVAEGIYAGNFGKDRPIAGVTHQRIVSYVRKAGFWIVTDRMRSDQSHNYTLDWRFGIKPGHPSDFTDDQIKVEQDNALVETTRPTGANVSLFHFPSVPLSFTTTLERTPPTQGYRLHDFFRASATWKAQAQSVVVTAIYPREAPGDNLKDIKKLNLPGAEGFEATLPDGARVLYAAATTIPGRLALGGLTASGESLLVFRGPDGVRHGIALGCKSLIVDGKAAALPGSDFEFDLGIRQVKFTPIYTPVEPVEIQPSDTTAFVGQQTVTLTCTTPGAPIHYTLDGTDPTPASPFYRGPFVLTGSAAVRARAFRVGVTAAPTTMSCTEASLATGAFFAAQTPGKAAGAPTTVPGLSCDFYEGPWQQLMMGLERMTPVKSGHVDRLFDEGLKGTAPTFAFKYAGFIQTPADGVYNFYAPPEFYEPNILSGYDLHLFIDGKEWYPATSRHALGIWSIALQKGQHSFTVTFADLRGDAVKKMDQPGQQPWVWTGSTPSVEISGPGLRRGPIPTSMLSCAG